MKEIKKISSADEITGIGNYTFKEFDVEGFVKNYFDISFEKDYGFYVCYHTLNNRYQTKFYSTPVFIVNGNLVKHYKKLNNLIKYIKKEEIDVFRKQII